MWDFDRARHAVDGSSHMCSVADVMLGAFRYCVNEPNNREAGKAMFPVGMMWKREHKGKIYVNDCGLVYRPANVKAEMHQAEYGAGELGSCLTPFSTVSQGSMQPSGRKYAYLQLRRQLSKKEAPTRARSFRVCALGGPTVQGAPQREYCHDYGAEHQGDDGETVFAFHLPRPLALHRVLRIQHISITSCA